MTLRAGSLYVGKRMFIFLFLELVLKIDRSHVGVALKIAHPVLHYRGTDYMYVQIRTQAN